jgi:hypothetical protein
MTQFEDVVLTPRESEVLDDMLVNGGSFCDGAGQRLLVKLKACMPDVTWHGLLAQEFIRRQDEVLAAQVRAMLPIVKQPLPATDEEIDSQFMFYVREKAKAAGA